MPGVRPAGAGNWRESHQVEDGVAGGNNVLEHAGVGDVAHNVRIQTISVAPISPRNRNHRDTPVPGVANNRTSQKPGPPEYQ
jgi:hypothetical protein